MTKRFLPGPIDVILVALHAYIGMRLLAPFGPAAQGAGAAFLVLTFWLMPRSWWIRERRSVWVVMVPWVATGFFSWLLVLTLVRNAALLAGALALSPEANVAWARTSAIAVMVLTPAITLVYLRAYETVSHARESIARYIAFYNGLRPHTSLADRTPDAAYFAQMELKAAA